MAYVRSFCDEIIAVSLSNIVGRCDKVASSMAGEAAALFLDDDIAPVAGSQIAARTARFPPTSYSCCENP